jgi:hypothetical protein
MMIRYDVLTQSVSLEVSPEEVREINADVLALLGNVYCDLVRGLRRLAAGACDKGDAFDFSEEAARVGGAAPRPAP